MEQARKVQWIASSKADLKEFPDEVQNEIGHALWEIQNGVKPSNAKPLKGFHGTGVLELVENFDSDTYRAVYTVRFEEAIYVLHCFQKKVQIGDFDPKAGDRAD